MSHAEGGQDGAARGGRIFNMGGFRRMLVREETPMDYPEIHRLVKTAFATAKVTNGDEQNFVERLRAGADYVPELALVAEEGGILVGHIMLTGIPFRTDNGGKVRALSLGPVSVLAEYRNRRIGTNLIKEALRRAVEMEFDAVFLVGDPAYYSRFGFVETSKFRIRHNGAIPDRYVQVLEIRRGALVPGEVAILHNT